MRSRRSDTRAELRRRGSISEHAARAPHVLTHVRTYIYTPDVHTQVVFFRVRTVVGTDDSSQPPPVPLQIPLCLSRSDGPAGVDCVALPLLCSLRCASGVRLTVSQRMKLVLLVLLIVLLALPARGPG